MALSQDDLGSIQAYIASGADFDEFFVEQRLPKGQRAEAKKAWDSIVADIAAHPGETMLVPSD